MSARQSRPVFVIAVRPERHVEQPYRMLRRGLKFLGRRLRFERRVNQDNETGETTMKTLKIEIIDGDFRETFEMPMKFDTLDDNTLEDVVWDLGEVSEEKLDEMQWWLMDRDDKDPRDLLVYWAELLHRQSKKQQHGRDPQTIVAENEADAHGRGFRENWELLRGKFPM